MTSAAPHYMSLMVPSGPGEGPNTDAKMLFLFAEYGKQNLLIVFTAKYLPSGDKII